jgi:hypothetical protein
MRRSNLIAVGACVLLVVLSTTAGAQGRRGGGGRRGSGGPEGGRGIEAMKVLDDADLDKVDPARVLLDNAKALKLSDGQKGALDSVVTRYEWNVHRFAKNVDSLAAASRRERIANRVGADAPAPADSGGTEERATHRALLEAVQSIRDEFDAASSRSLERLTDDQRKQANDLLQAGRAKLEQMLSRV